MPKSIRYETYPEEFVTYRWSALKKDDMRDIEKYILSIIEGDGHIEAVSFKPKKISLARYVSKDKVFAASVTPDMAPVDVIRLDYDDSWYLRGIRNRLIDMLSQKYAILDFKGLEQEFRTKEFGKYDIMFVYYDPWGFLKSASEMAFVIKGYSLIVFYYRYSFHEPVKCLVDEIL